jgi:pimeloyl-ACP methyl ester carboxylesterase
MSGAMIPQPRRVSVSAERVVGLYEYGDRDGDPVFVLHGTPACGAGFTWADGPALERGVKLLAPDRPGVGVSTRVAGGTVGNYPERLVEVADALGLDRFGVWGYSGGGPYAVACAARLGDRLTRVAVVAGMGQVGAWATSNDFEKTDRQLLNLSAKRPGLARLVLAPTARLARVSPRSAKKSFAKQLSEPDQQVLNDFEDPAEAMALFTQAFLNGTRGVVDDYSALARPWGIDLSAVSVPVCIFHGDADQMVPLRHSQELARRLPHAEMVTWAGAGHLGAVTHVADVLDWLAVS